MRELHQCVSALHRAAPMQHQNCPGLPTATADLLPSRVRACLIPARCTYPGMQPALRPTSTTWSCKRVRWFLAQHERHRMAARTDSKGARCSCKQSWRLLFTLCCPAPLGQLHCPLVTSTAAGMDHLCACSYRSPSSFQTYQSLNMVTKKKKKDRK